MHFTIYLFVFSVNQLCSSEFNVSNYTEKPTLKLVFFNFNSKSKIKIINNALRECDFILPNKSILYCIIDMRNTMYFIYKWMEFTLDFYSSSSIVYH